MDAAKPIIIKRVKKSGAHGHHGGAWKVAFADFVTAMMAFFLLMWLMGSTTPEERAAIADYFENPNGVIGPGGASTSMIKQGAVQAEVATTKKSDERDSAKIKVVERDGANDQQRLASLKTELEQAILQSDTLKEFKDQLLLDITPEGLRIQIIDKENRPMFDIGSSHLKEYTSTILYEIAKIINKVPNKISLTGHTDATPFSSIRGYTNWELSTDRANASRRALVLGGLDESKVAKVVGLSSTVLFDKQNPRNSMNRRISMIVMNKEAEDALHNDNAEQVQSSAEAANLVSQGHSPSPGVGAPQDPVTMPTLLPLRNPEVIEPSTSQPPPKENSPSHAKALPAPIRLPLKKNR
jgi:chemotaxis protein MotB